MTEAMEMSSPRRLAWLVARGMNRGREFNWNTLAWVEPKAAGS